MKLSLSSWNEKKLKTDCSNSNSAPRTRKLVCPPLLIRSFKIYEGEVDCFITEIMIVLKLLANYSDTGLLYKKAVKRDIKPGIKHETL